MRIAFEGSDGSGKSTQVKLFCEYLKKIGVPVKLFHEPRILREQIFAKCKEPGVDDAEVSYMFGVDGYLCREDEVQCSWPTVIVRDRDTTISQYPYHHGFGTPDQMIFLMAYLLNKVNTVDLVFFVDVDFDVAFGRIKARASEKAIVDYFEKESKLRKIHQNYKDLFSSPEMLEKMGLEKAEVIRIDGNGDVESIRHKIIDEFHECTHIVGHSGLVLKSKEEEPK